MFIRKPLEISRKISLLQFTFLLAMITNIFAGWPVFAQQSGRQKLPVFRAQTDKSAVKVPFDLYGNNILVPVRINNSSPVWFVFDTGASVNIINARIAQKLGLAIKGSGLLDGNGGMASGSFIENTIIDLPGVRASNQTIVAVPLDALAEYSGREVQGLIGNNFIQNFVVEIDYARRTLIFHNPRNYTIANDPDAVVLENHDGTPFIKSELSLDGKTVITDSFEVDTGSTSVFALNKPFAEENRVLQLVPPTSIAEGVGGAGVGGELSVVNARIFSIKLGKYTLDKPIIGILADKNGNAANHLTGFMGSDLLRRFTVILDYKSQRMLLKPNVDFNEPFEIDLSGLELVTETNNFNIIKIKHVRAGFPAAAAGLRAGDILTAVDSRPSAEYGLDKLSKMFRKSGRRYHVTVRRGEKIITSELNLKRVI